MGWAKTLVMKLSNHQDRELHVVERDGDWHLQSYSREGGFFDSIQLTGDERNALVKALGG